MSITLKPEGTTQVASVAVKGSTQVKRVVVGTPIRRVNTARVGDISEISGINTTGSVQGSILIYNATSGDYEAKLLLEEQEVNGGQY